MGDAFGKGFGGCLGIIVAVLVVIFAFVAIGICAAERADADGNCSSHHPYKVTDGHGHDRDGDGVGCAGNPRWPAGRASSSTTTQSTTTSGYDRDNWGYNSSAARDASGCSRAEHVDHVVALKEAYDSGAASWSSTRKRQFANDRSNQWCLLASVNQSKSDGDLAEWGGGTCEQRKEIARVTIAVKRKYGLTIDAAEGRANAAALAATCGASAPVAATTSRAAPNVRSTTTPTYTLSGDSGLVAYLGTDTASCHTLLSRMPNVRAMWLYEYNGE